MSRFLISCVLLSFAVACSSPTDDGGGGDGEGGGGGGGGGGAADYRVSGILLDSLSAVVLPSETVHLGSRSTTTDAQGAFSFDGVPGGTVGLSAEVDGYRTYSRDIELAGDTAVDARLLRLRPYLESLSESQEGYVAVWMDLDGVGDLRGGLRPIRVFTAAGDSTVLLNTMADDVDELRREYRYAEPPGSPPAARVVLLHEDEAGHRVTFECTPSWSCEEVSDDDG